MRTKIIVISMLFFCGFTFTGKTEESESLLSPKIKGRVVYQRDFIYGEWFFEYSYEGNIKDIVPIEYENASNSQKIIKRTDSAIFMRNTAKLTFFNSKVPFPVGERYVKFSILPREYRKTVVNENKQTTNNQNITNPYLDVRILSKDDYQYLKDIADKATQGVSLQSEAVEKIMEYIRANVEYSLGVSTSPADVLKNGAAYCMGYASAAVYLLRLLGIPARSLICYIPPGFQWGFGNSGGFHEYVEAYYEDLGWVSYDPQHSVHFSDPYHILIGYGDDIFSQNRSYVSYLKKGLTKKNFISLIGDLPVYNTFFHNFYIRTPETIAKKIPHIPVKVHLKGITDEAGITIKETTSNLSKYPKNSVSPVSFDDYYQKYCNSANDRYNGFFYMKQNKDNPTKYKLEAKGTGANLDFPFEVPVGSNEITIDITPYITTFQVITYGNPEKNSIVEISQNFITAKSDLKFQKIGNTNNNGLLLTNEPKEGDAILKTTHLGRPSLYAVSIKKGETITCTDPMNSQDDAMNFLKIAKLLKTPVAIAGIITLPNNQPASRGTLSLISSSDQKQLLRIDDNGAFKYESNKEENEIQVDFSKGPYLGEVSVTKKDFRIDEFLDFNFTSKSIKIEIKTPYVYLYTPEKEGYSYSYLQPDTSRCLYFMTNKKEFFIGSEPTAINVIRITPESKNSVLSDETLPEEMAKRYEEFAKHISRKEGWSAFGYLKNINGAIEKTYEAFRQIGTTFYSFDVHKSGAFIIYGKDHPNGSRIVLRKKGYYYKSGNLEKGHYTLAADFSTNQHFTVQREAGSTRQSVYIHTSDGALGVAEYDTSGKVLIQIDGDFSLSPDGKIENAVRSQDKAKNGRIEM